MLTDEQLRTTLEPLHSHVGELITPLVGVKSGDQNRAKSKVTFLGTGTYFSYQGFPFVLTARHVVETSSNFDNLCHGTGSRDKPFLLRSGWRGIAGDSDIAIWGCFQSILDDANIKPLSYKEFLVPSDEHLDALHFCNGYPLEFMTEFPSIETIFSGNPIASPRVKLPDQYDESIHFAIEYPSKVRPPGMSGSPVWNTRLHHVQAIEEWSLDCVTFAGVVQRWHEDEAILICTRVESIRDFIPSAVNYMRQQYGWKTGDD